MWIEAAGEIIGQYGGVQDLLSALRAFPDNKSIASNCCGALWSLAVSGMGTKIYKCQLFHRNERFTFGRSNMLYLGLFIIISTLFLFLLWQLLQRLQSHCLNYFFHETPDNLWWLSIMHSATFLFPVIHGLWTILSYPQLYSSSEWVPIVMDLGTLWFSDSIVQLISNLCFVLAGFLLF